jgi:hypothetical protein
MKNKSLLILAVTLGVLCLVGTAYAHWSKTIYIEGYARSGTLDWVWSDVKSWDPYTPNQNNNDQTCEDGFPVINFQKVWMTDKDVGWTEAGIMKDRHYMWVHLYNAYPSYCVEITTHVLVTGTIPIHVYEVIFTTMGGDYLGHYASGMPQVIQMDVDQDGDLDIEVHWNEVFPVREPYGFQYHYGDWEEISFYIHVLNSADQMAVYEFMIELPGINYNECITVCD